MGPQPPESFRGDLGPNPNGLPQKLLRTPDAAKYLDLSASALEKYRVLGRGPAFVKLGLPIPTMPPTDSDMKPPGVPI